KLRMYECPELFSTNRGGHVSCGFHAKHSHWDPVVHAQAKRGRLDHLEPLNECVVVADFVEQGGIWIVLRVSVVHTVHPALCYKHFICMNFERALGSYRVGREIWETSTGTENDHSAFFHVAYGTLR